MATCERCAREFDSERAAEECAWDDEQEDARARRAFRKRKG